MSQSIKCVLTYQNMYVQNNYENILNTATELNLVEAHIVNLGECIIEAFRKDSTQQIAVSFGKAICVLGPTSETKVHVSVTEGKIVTENDIFVQ